MRTPVLHGDTELCEVWRCSDPLTSGGHNRVRFRRSDELLFGCIAVAEEASRRPARGHHPRLRRDLHHARYRAATRTCCGSGTTCRTSTANPAARERYREFNSARQQALRARGRALTGNVPAASALGAAHGSPLVVYFLAGRTAPTFVENPRQVSAYHYPRQYGSHSPVFSRAALVRHSGRLALFISGTASIVGHRSTARRGHRRADARDAGQYRGAAG